MDEHKKVPIRLLPVPVIKARGIINPAATKHSKTKNMLVKVTNPRSKQPGASNQNNSNQPTNSKQSTDLKNKSSPTSSSHRSRSKTSSCALKLKEVKVKSPKKDTSDSRKRSSSPKKVPPQHKRGSASECPNFCPKLLEKFKIPKRPTARPQPQPVNNGKQDALSHKRDLLDNKRAPNEDTKCFNLNLPASRKRLSFDGNRDESKAKKRGLQLDNDTSSKIAENDKPKLSPQQKIMSNFKDKRNSVQVAVFATDERTYPNRNIVASDTVDDAHNQQNSEQEAGEAMDFDNPLPEIFQLLTKSHKKINDKEDAMDIDLIIPTNANNGKQLIVIPDTNVWIDNRATLELLLETEFYANCHTSIIIPWMVLQEIDYNIHRRTEAQLFRAAAKFIYHLLSEKSTRVRGEKATEALIGIEFNALMADDSILSCAMQYNKLLQFKTVFLTNDVNLLNKALVHNINAFKPDKLLHANIQKIFQTENDVPFISPPPPDMYNNIQNNNIFQQFPQSNNDRRSEEFSSCTVMEIDDPMEEISHSEGPTQLPESNFAIPATFDTVVIALKQTLTNIIVLKMVEEYGAEGWKFAIKIKPPFTVERALKCIQVHWIAVFSFMFSNQGKNTVDELINAFRKKPEINELNSWRQVICQLAFNLLSINKEIAKRPRVIECCQLLQNYIQNQSSSSQKIY